MNFYYFDALQFVAFLAAVWGVWKWVGTKKKMFLAPAGLMGLMIFLVPVNLTSKNASSRFVTAPVESEKQTVEQVSFQAHQANKFKQLKQQSQDLRNEEIN